MDQKELKSVVNQSLKEIILPRFEKVEERLGKIEGNQKKHDEGFKSNDAKLEKIIKKLDATFDAVGETKVEVTVLQENVSDQGYTLERIETKLDSTTRRQDDFSIKADQLNRRVLKLETKKA